MLSKGVLWNSMVRKHLRAAFAVHHHRGVAFLVEGLSVDVPQTLLDQFPDTKFAKLAMGSQAKEDEPIEIDIDLLHFRYIIDYMRNGKVTLAHPGMVDKESLRTKLDKFGFQDTNGLLVENTDTSFSSTAMHAKKNLDILQSEWESRLAAVCNEHEAATTSKEKARQIYKYGCLAAARFLFFEHLRTNELELIFSMCAGGHVTQLQTIHTCVYNGNDFDPKPDFGIKHLDGVSEDDEDDHEDIKFMIELCEEDSELRNYHQDCMMLYGLEYTKLRTNRSFGLVTLKPALR